MPVHLLREDAVMAIGICQTITSPSTFKSLLYIYHAHAANLTLPEIYIQKLLGYIRHRIFAIHLKVNIINIVPTNPKITERLPLPFLVPSLRHLCMGGQLVLPWQRL